MLGMAWDAEQYRIQASLIGRNRVWQQDHRWRQERRLRADSQESMSQVNSDRVLSPCELRSPTTFCYLALDQKLIMDVPAFFDVRVCV